MNVNYESANFVFSLIALLVSFTSVLFVYIQQKLLFRQLKLESYNKVIAVNRELLVLGFDDPELFDVLEGKRIKSTRKEKKYLQLWINQANLMFNTHRERLISQDMWNSFKNDIESLFETKNVRSHWKDVKFFYQQDFVAFVDDIVRKLEG